MGRPKIIISEEDWPKINDMMVARCSGQSIADHFNICYDTLDSSIKERCKSDFSVISKQKEEVGDDMLKQRAFNFALSSEPGSCTMLIFLLKARCGFTDKPQSGCSSPS